MKIAICNDISEFGCDRLKYKNWSDRFPGTGWLYILYKTAQKNNWEVASGDIALSHIQNNFWKANEIFIIQELDSIWGKRLRASGANPFLLTCFESPLYAHKFYDKFEQLRSIFPFSMVPNLSKNINNEKLWGLHFPCYWQKELSRPVQWSVREPMVLVAANKYWSNEGEIPSFLKPRRLAHWSINFVNKKLSKSYRKARSSQLHDERFKAIEYFSKINKLTIYGSGWDNLSHLPTDWQKRLYESDLSFLGKTEDKIQTQSKYKFALCYENVSSPGYVTEKIIEAIVSGTIPIYLGAPDIESYIPKEAFIDVRVFENMNSLNVFLENLSEEEAEKIINKGREFLISQNGRLYNYEGYTEWVTELLGRLNDAS